MIIKILINRYLNLLIDFSYMPLIDSNWNNFFLKNSTHAKKIVS